MYLHCHLWLSVSFSGVSEIPDKMQQVTRSRRFCGFKAAFASTSYNILQQLRACVVDLSRDFFGASKLMQMGMWDLTTKPGM